MALPQGSYKAIGDPVRLTSLNTGDPQHAARPSGSNPITAALITVSSNPARLAFEDQTVDDTHGIVLPNGALPWICPLSQGVRALATAAGATVVDIIWLGY